MNQLCSFPLESNQYGVFGREKGVNCNCGNGWYLFLSSNKKFLPVILCLSHSNIQFWLRTRSTCNCPIPFMDSNKLILLTVSSSISYSFRCTVSGRKFLFQHEQKSYGFQCHPRKHFRAALLWVQNGIGFFMTRGPPVLGSTERSHDITVHQIFLVGCHRAQMPRP